jgi:hypothetical protein
MNTKEIGVIAKTKGIKPGKLKKADLIHAIQRKEGNFDCFAKAYDGQCDQMDCIWRIDCLGQHPQKAH